MALALDEPRDDDHHVQIDDIRCVVAALDADALTPFALRIDYLDDRFGRGFQVFTVGAAACSTPW